MLPETRKIDPAILPVTVADKLNWLRLTRSRRVGPATFVRLVNEYRTIEGALAALPEVARFAGVSDYEAHTISAADREYDAGLHAGMVPVFLGAPDYPPLLALSPDAPAFLWARGDLALAAKPCVALVGARNASSMGLRMAGRLAKELGEAGLVIVSGLARGIDGAAHQSTLDTGTIAVQAGGLDIAYPRENAVLQAQINEQGLALSEQPVGLIPQARNFPQRNRIIAGLSKGVVVVEGAMRSGSLITARNAGELGRDVMAVPGNPLDGRAAGCNKLIRDGATLVRSARDVIEAIGGLTGAVGDTGPEDGPKQDMPQHSETTLSDLEDRIAACLSGVEMGEDDLIRSSGLPAVEVTRHIAQMELSGSITRGPGGKLALAV